jgi:Amt family ammonium transporter
VAYTLIYSGGVSLVLLKVIDALVGLRVDVHDERVGLDLTDHAEHAYTLLE